MLLTQRILYAVAFDAIEAQVSSQVVEISKALGAAVYLLAVIPQRYDFWQSDHSAQARMHEKLESVAGRLSEEGARMGHMAVVKGNQSVVAMEAAHRMRCDFIVLGAGEPSLQAPGFTRTTAKTLARAAEQHVWICKPHAKPVPEHIISAYNDTPGSSAGVHTSIDLARQFKAKMQLLSALAPPHPGLFGGDETERLEALDAAKRALLDQRRGDAEGFNFSGVSLTRNFCWSQLASEAVLNEASRYHDGLLVMGTAGRRRFPTMMLGNTAEKILRSCQSSMLVVK